MTLLQVGSKLAQRRLLVGLDESLGLARDVEGPAVFVAHVLDQRERTDVQNHIVHRHLSSTAHRQRHVSRELPMHFEVFAPMVGLVLRRSVC